MHSPSIRKTSNQPKTDIIQLYIPGMFVESARMPRPGLQVDRRECTGTLAALHPWGSF